MKDSPDQQPVSKDAPKRSLINEEGRISRRGFMGLFSTAMAGLALTTMMQAGSKGEKNPKVPEAQKPTVTTPPKQVQTQEKPTGLETLSDMDLLNSILAMPLGTEKRKEAEGIYSSRAQTLIQLDLGIFVLVDPGSREDLLKKRFEMRQTGKSDLLTPVPDDLLEWCAAEGISPEAMGACMDARKIAKKMIQVFLDRSVEAFRPDFFEPKLADRIPARLREKVEAADLMMNLGGMAKLIMTETSGFTNIGILPAISQLNEDAFPNAISDLKKICEIQKAFTGLDYRVENIPGSEKVKGTKSGGAIGGSQVMPPLALEMIKVGQSVGKNIIIFQNTWSAVMAWIKTAKTTKLNNDMYAVGYIVGNEPGLVGFRADSLEQWNPDPNQPGSILQTANRFSDKFGHKYS